MQTNTLKKIKCLPKPFHYKITDCGHRFPRLGHVGKDRIRVTHTMLDINHHIMSFCFQPLVQQAGIIIHYFEIRRRKKIGGRWV